MIFRNRAEAGRMLAERLRSYAHRTDVIVLALPRGGVPVAFEIARALNAPLEVFVVRKLGVPGQVELAFGAVASGGVCVLNAEIIEAVNLSKAAIDEVTDRERKEMDRRERLYRGDRPPLDVRGRVVILVDDGIATGSSIRAAISALRRLQPSLLIVAAPVAPPETCSQLLSETDELVCLDTPGQFQAIGQFYEDFSEVTDGEVIEMLRRATSEPVPAPVRRMPRFPAE